MQLIFVTLTAIELLSAISNISANDVSKIKKNHLLD
jgi:hypothetical protein